MLPVSVYSPAMQTNARPALLQRIGRLLRAKEFLVFFAIGLGVLDFGAPLATGWLFRHRSLATLLHTNNSVAGDAVAGGGWGVIAVAVAYLLVSAFFTAGYLRSLLGRLHWGPRDARQFSRLFALLALVAALPFLIDANKFRSGYLSGEDRNKLAAASAKLGKAPMLVDDTPARTVTEIAACARRLKRKQNLGLIVIDYLQLLDQQRSKPALSDQLSALGQFARATGIVLGVLETVGER